MDRIVILGAAESGVGAAVLAQKKVLTCLYPTWELFRNATKPS